MSLISQPAQSLSSVSSLPEKRRTIGAATVQAVVGTIHARHVVHMLGKSIQVNASKCLLHPLRARVV